MRFEIYTDRKGEFRWRLKARNGKVVGDSGEGYKREAACMRAAAKYRDRVGSATIRRVK